MGQSSTIVRASTSKDGDLLSQFDKFSDGDTYASMINASVKEMLIDNHKEVANNGKVKSQLSLEHISGFSKLFEKITKSLGFYLTVKMNDLQINIFTLIATDNNVTTHSLYFFVPILIPNSQTQVLFNESLKNNFKITYGSRYTEQKTIY